MATAAGGGGAGDAVVVYVTVPSQAVADGLSEALVGARLAACVNIVPGVTSVYWWDGKVNRDSELLLVMKTRGELVPDLTAAVSALWGGLAGWRPDGQERREDDGARYPPRSPKRCKQHSTHSITTQHST